MASHPLRGLLQPVGDVRRAADDERVIPVGPRGLVDRPQRDLEPGPLDRQRDPLGDPLRGSVA